MEAATKKRKRGRPVIWATEDGKRLDLAFDHDLETGLTYTTDACTRRARQNNVLAWEALGFLKKGQQSVGLLDYPWLAPKPPENAPNGYVWHVKWGILSELGRWLRAKFTAESIHEVASDLCGMEPKMTVKEAIRELRWIRLVTIREARNGS